MASGLCSQGAQDCDAMENKNKAMFNDHCCHTQPLKLLNVSKLL